MNLQQFATEAGVEITTCDPDWGGTIAYMEKDYPDTRVCGFRTENSAYKHWFVSEFGESHAKAILKLLKLTERKSKVKRKV